MEPSTSVRRLTTTRKPPTGNSLMYFRYLSTQIAKVQGPRPGLTMNIRLEDSTRPSRPPRHLQASCPGE